MDITIHPIFLAPWYLRRAPPRPAPAIGWTAGRCLDRADEVEPDVLLEAVGLNQATPTETVKAAPPQEMETR
ncbi:hypothetical protein ABZX62_15495 [Streptomyces flavidovirens]|uniref:Uncharacterized protein n=1 Tax=Streptomyces flavidovirens TaxID=67298 RepID=A0ABW6RHI5_9ACTN